MSLEEDSILQEILAKKKKKKKKERKKERKRKAFRGNVTGPGDPYYRLSYIHLLLLQTQVSELWHTQEYFAYK